MKKLLLLCSLAVAAANAQTPIRVNVARDDGSVTIRWTGGEPPYRVQRSVDGAIWVDVTADLTETTYTIPLFNIYQPLPIPSLGAVPPLRAFPTDDFGFDILLPPWTFIDPRSDSSLVVSRGAVHISVPAGLNHDTWTGSNKAARIMQPARNIDFEMEVNFLSTPLIGQSNQQQGILIEEDDGNLLLFDVYSAAAKLNAFSAVFIDGLPTDQVTRELFENPEEYFLRVERVGNLWTFSYSVESLDWTVINSFNHPMVVRQVGVFAGNAGDSPAFESVINYVANRFRVRPSFPPIFTRSEFKYFRVRSAVEEEPSSVTLSWEPVPDAVRYLVQYGIRSGVYTEQTNVVAPTLTITGLAAATTYFFIVIAVDSNGQQSDPSNEIQYTP